MRRGSKKYLVPLNDPNPIPHLGDPNNHILYLRLHGTPEIYKSKYSDENLNKYAANLYAFSKNNSAWCIFDNTTFGHATGNALLLTDLLRKEIQGFE